MAGNQQNGDSPRKVGSHGFRWIIRILLYGTALVIAWPLLNTVIFFKQLEAIEESCVAKASSCLDPKTGILKALPVLVEVTEESCAMMKATRCIDPKTVILKPVFVPIQEKAAEKTRIPCRYVGTWSTMKRGSSYSIVLDESGRYDVTLNQGRDPGSPVDQGYWAVQGKSMLWRTARNIPTEIDVNPIIAESETEFELLEMNGNRTRFELVVRGTAQNCSS
jgi:hypothetical protein